ncbi:MAG: hypothetical protein L6V93_19820 [Clostridiales bacterium]|nr:MAG: hypothetical protein L6V93_19820 [Clostridiales bacterium]
MRLQARNLRICTKKIIAVKSDDFAFGRNGNEKGMRNCLPYERRLGFAR